MSEGLTGIAALEAEMKDRLAAKDAEIERLQGVVGEARELLRRWRAGDGDIPKLYDDSGVFVRRNAPEQGGK